MNETKLDVKGMTCGSCVRHIDGALKRLDGVAQVDVRLREGRVVVQHRADVAPAAIVGAIEEAGFDACLAA